MGNDLQLYKQLLSLPLFQGLSKGDLEEVVTHTRLGFETYNEGQYIVQENAPCHQLIFILKGDQSQLFDYRDTACTRIVATRTLMGIDAILHQVVPL